MDGNVLPFSALDLGVRRFTLQASGAAKIYVACVLDPASPGASIAAATANYEVSPGAVPIVVEADDNAADRGELFNLKFWFADGTASDVLIISYQEEVFNNVTT